GTLTLQDQLYGRDLPLLGAAVGRPVRVTLLKGRGNYLCRHRLETAQRGRLRDPALLKQLLPVAAWATTTATGDLNEIADFSPDHASRPWLTSTADNCLGSHCEFFDACFVLEARRRAQRAEVVIVNHHLLVADLALKEAGFGELLPGAQAVIVDEAHQLPEIAQQFFGVSVGSRELESLARDILAESQAAGVAGDLQRLSDRLARSAASARVQPGQVSGRARWSACPPQCQAALSDWARLLRRLKAALEPARQINPGLQRCAERCQDGIERLDALESTARDGLRWVEFAPRSFTAHWSPLDVGAQLGARIKAHGATWVFTSATLAVGRAFDHFLQRVGVTDARTRVLPSPFDYRQNARLYLPAGLPAPAHADYVAALLASTWPLIEAAGGGAFLLFTSYRALNEAHEWIEHRDRPGPLLVQGARPRTELLRRFRQTGDAVLLGTSSFWQGVDVRGPALRLIVIDKLPFAPPGDPLIEARLESIRQDGGDPFGDFQLPQAVLALKQGVGRLIRDFSDRGLLILGDPRLRTRGYGQTFLHSLPPMPILDDHEAALEFAGTLCAGETASIHRERREPAGL
ncbi:MAG: ATP-dependent DNA helicase, partial [Rhodospirillaceae bacterium]|nr:ATP-dependent DNA helicase [Rhodospirillaceae bacterium]